MFAVVDGARLWMASSGRGAGPTIVWLHGGPGLWDYLAPVAAITDDLCVSYRYDQRGCGRSFTAGPHTVSQNVADLEQLRIHWGLNRFVAAGHSWGASLALFYGLAYPERVSGLILISSHGLVPGSREHYQSERARRLGAEGEVRRRALAQQWAGNNTIENERAYCAVNWATDFVDPAHATTLLVEDLRINREVNSELGADSNRLAEAPGFQDRLRALYVETLVVHGAADPRPAWAARDVVQLLPDGSLLLLERAGHCPWVERPGEFSLGLRSFVQAVARRG
jgi:proline iminopeptidase